jgi:single-strand DNA-binding protein
MNLNKAFILGNLANDPVIRALPSGQSVANFSVATNRFYYDKDRQKQQQTEFHNIVAFGRSAEIVQQYLKKGSMVLIEGRIQTRNWQDPSSGDKRYKTEIIAERLQLGPRTASFQTSSEFPISDQSQVQKERIQEDIPIIEEGKEESSSPEKKPLEDKGRDDEEIDVKDIPF